MNALSGWCLHDFWVTDTGGVFESWQRDADGRVHMSYTPARCGPGDRLPPQPRGPVDDDEEDQ